MSPSPTNSFEFAKTSPHNEAMLAELAGAIALSQGSDELLLLLVRCNYGQLREQMVARLVAVLAAEKLQGPVQVVQLAAAEQDVYGRVAAARDACKPGVRPGAVLVLGFEGTTALSTLLVNMNQRREAFRRNFAFPLVLWFTDSGHHQFRQHAEDFESLTSGDTIEFQLGPEALTHCLRQATQHVFDTLLAPDTPKSFNQSLQTLALGYLAPEEVAIARASLQEQTHPLDPDLQAGLTFVEGLNVPSDVAIAHFEASADYWRSQSDEPAAGLKQGLAQFFLGRARYFAADIVKDRQPDWARAVPPLETSLTLFDQAQRPDLVAKAIIQLARVLHRLQRWDDLERGVHRALPLHQRYGLLRQAAQDYGFLADIALHRQQWTQAADLAQQALDTLARDTHTSWWRILFLKLLAQANHALGHTETAIQHLQVAQAMGVLAHPKLHSDVLGLLQTCLRQQQRYLEAFQIKRERLAIEKQYGLRAFIGAGRLRSQRTEQRPTVRSQRQTLEDIAPEIAASGRYQDLVTLLQRIGGTTHKLLVLHGASGVGKSSLITGGLLPALQAQALENRANLPILMRQYTDWPREIAAALAAALTTTQARVIAPPAGESPIAPILDTLRQCETAHLRPVLIFDQFEEFFFANPDPLRRRTFFQFLADCLELQPSALKIVLSLREDYLHYLLEAKQLARRNQLPPGSMARSQLQDILGQQVLYEIGNFSPADAGAIVQQLVDSSRTHLDRALIAALVEDLAGELQEVRPIELQIVGAQLQTEGIETLAAYRQLGPAPKETLVQRYLADVVADCGAAHSPLAELVLFLLTDERGTRPLKTRPELVRELKGWGIEVAGPHTAGPQPPDAGGFTSDSLTLVLRILCGSGIVMHLPDTPDDRYQLVHDYLAEFIQKRQRTTLLKELELTRKEKQAAEVERDRLFESNQLLKEARNRAGKLLTATSVASTMILILSMATAAGIIARVNDRREQIKIAAELEQQGNYAIRQFEFSQLEALSTAVDASIRLRELVDGNTPIDDFPALSPLIALQRVTHNITEKRRFEIEEAQAVWAEFSPSNGFIAAGSGSGEVVLINLKKEKIEHFEAHKNSVWRMAFSPIREEFVTASGDGYIYLWDFSGNKKSEIGTYDGWISGVKFSPDGNKIVASNLNGTISIWDSSGKLLGEFSGHESEVFWLDFSPDGESVVTAGEDGTARIWTLDGEQIAIMKGHEGEVISVSFSPDGKLIATSGEDGTARIWALDGKQVAVMREQAAVTSVSFNPNGKSIATGGDDGSVRIWDLAGRQLHFMKGHQERVWSVNFSSQGQNIVTAGEDGTVRLWDLSSKELSQWQANTGTVWSARFSGDGKQVIASGPGGQLLLWRNNVLDVEKIDAHDGEVYWIDRNPNGEHLATAGEDGMTKIWNLKGDAIRQWRGLEGKAFNVNYSSDGKLVVTVGESGEIDVREASGRSVKKLRESNGSIYRASFNPDSNLIATASQNGKVSIWDLRTSKSFEFNAHKGGTLWVSFSPDGKLIASSGRDGKARLWNLKGDEISRLDGHQGKVTWVGFYGEQELLVTAGVDGTVRFWTLSGNEIARFDGHQDGVYSVDFNEDGSLMIVGDAKGAVKSWVIPSLTGLISDACSWLDGVQRQNGFNFEGCR